MTHVGRSKPSELMWPVEMSASAMTPIVFCASFVPCVNATKLPDTICARRNTRLTRLGDRLRMTQMITSISASAMRKPRIGDSIPGFTTLSQMPCHSMTCQPS